MAVDKKNHLFNHKEDLKNKETLVYVCGNSFSKLKQSSEYSHKFLMYCNWTIFIECSEEVLV